MDFINQRLYILGFFLIIAFFSTNILCWAGGSNNIAETDSDHDISELSNEIHFSQSVMNNFDLVGIVDGIYENRIVVSDSDLQLQNNTQTFEIKVGEYVGIQLDEANKVKLITKLLPLD